MDAKGNGELRILADKSDGAKFHIEAQNWSVSFKTIDGTYPAYNRVIPEFEAKATATISASAVRRLPRFGDHSSEAVAIDTAASAMTMKNASHEFEVTVPVQAKGGGIRIGFNARYLRMFAAQSQVMRFDLNSPSDPARVLDDDPRLLRVVMPMRV
jgi:DNA polymerase III sliding clamp (beta) subunit (PCNA family)